MKVEVKRKNETPIESIDVGDAFLWSAADDTLLMKVKHNGGLGINYPEGKFYAVNIHTGIVVTINRGTHVIPVETITTVIK